MEHLYVPTVIWCFKDLYGFRIVSQKVYFLGEHEVRMEFQVPRLVNRNCLTRRKLLNLLNLSFLICKVGMILISLQLFSLFFVLVNIQDVVCMTLTECLPPSSYSLRNNSARSLWLLGITFIEWIK